MLYVGYVYHVPYGEHVTDRPPRVECSVCGRELTATTRPPYGVRIDGREHRYWQVRAHNTPGGEPCPGFHSRPMAVVPRTAMGE